MLRPSSRTARPLLGLLSAGLLLTAAACGDDDDDASSTEPAAAATDAATATTAGADASTETTEGTATTARTETTEGTGTTAGAGAGGGSTVAIAESSLGPILVDDAGMTLYMFVPDDSGPSTCTDQCLEAWPAVAGPVSAGEGVDASLLATAARPDDGSQQATCNGWPLYTFARDEAPGDVTGQGVNDVWYVLDATCTPVGMP